MQRARRAGASPRTVDRDGFAYDVDTLPGQSGGPVLINDAQAIGLHRSGIRGQGNVGVSVKQILAQAKKDLKNNRPNPSRLFRS